MPQSVTCLTTDARLTADPGVGRLITAWSHTFVEIDHEIISTIILLSSADILQVSKKGRLFPEMSDSLQNIYESREDIGPVNTKRK